MSHSRPTKKRFIDKYSYISTAVLGEGYSGVVFLGKHQQTNKSCAIKIIQKQILKQQAHKSMILCEIQFLNLLKNKPFIMELYDVYNTKNNIYLVSQLCTTDLKEYLKQRKLIPEVQAIQLMYNIIKGYKSIWEAKIVHRDFKPSNILLKDNNEVKIADFGFSMYQKDKHEYQKINVGSPLYMPFQVLGYNKYGYQSDIWALGIIFYEMLTGRTPWKAKTEKELLQELKDFDIEKRLPTGITKRSKEFLLSTLATDPTKRIKPQQLAEFTFQDLYESMSMDMRNSIRFESAICLKLSLKKNKTLHQPEVEKKQQKVSDDSDEKIQQDIQIGIASHKDQNNLQNERMKNINNQQIVDKIKQLPINDGLSKKKKNAQRKTSLEVNYDEFENKANSNKVKEQTSDRKFKLDSFKTENNILIKNQKKQSKGAESPSNEQIKEIKSFEGKKLHQKSVKQAQQKKEYAAFEQMKQFSKILRSQIHFCRYMFKLLTRIIEHIPEQLKLVKPQFKQYLAYMIFDRLKRIQSTRIQNEQIMKEFEQTKQCDKIKKVIKQYRQKYTVAIESIELPTKFDNEHFKKLLRKAILHLYKRAYSAYILQQQRETKQSKTKVKRAPSSLSTSNEDEDDEMSEIMKIKQEIVILDYLITLKQLLRVQEKHGWAQFQKRSHIESIVEADPMTEIQQKHILAISEKLESLKIL